MSTTTDGRPAQRARLGRTTKMRAGVDRATSSSLPSSSSSYVVCVIIVARSSSAAADAAAERGGGIADAGLPKAAIDHADSVTSCIAAAAA